MGTVSNIEISYTLILYLVIMILEIFLNLKKKLFVNIGVILDIISNFNLF